MHIKHTTKNKQKTWGSSRATILYEALDRLCNKFISWGLNKQNTYNIRGNSERLLKHLAQSHWTALEANLGRSHQEQECVHRKDAHLGTSKRKTQRGQEQALANWAVGKWPVGNQLAPQGHTPPCSTGTRGLPHISALPHYATLLWKILVPSEGITQFIFKCP